jgi:hypothetical protein
MQRTYSRSLVDHLIKSVPIETLVSSYIRSPGHPRCMCELPRHSDDTSSKCWIYTDTNSFYCWVCKEGGSNLSFLMKAKGMTYAAAVLELARRAGISVAPPQKRVEVYTEAMQLWKEALQNTPGVQKHLVARGITEAVSWRFDIGYAPNKLLVNHISPGDLQAAGLINPGGFGLVEIFRNRLMFPFKMQGSSQCVQAQGRSLDPLDPVRWYHAANSSSSGFIDIHDYLFGEHYLNHYSSYVVVTEGPMDTLSLHTLGQPAVGLVGNHNIYKHWRKFQGIPKLYLCLDRDPQTQTHLLDQGAKLQRALPETIVHLVDLPFKSPYASKGDPKDPNDWLRLGGTKEAFQEALASSQTIYDRALETWLPLGNINDVLHLVSQSPESEQYLSKISSYIGKSCEYLQGRIDGINSPLST